MVSAENSEIKVTASDALEFEPVLHETSGGGWGVKIFLSLFLVGGAAWAWVLYGDALIQWQGGGDGRVPLIKAAAGPVKVRPKNPGGLKVPNRDKLVYDRIQKASGDDAGGERGPERLLPPPEQPIEKPKSLAKESSGKPAGTVAEKTPAKPEKLMAIKQTTPKPAKTNPVAKVPTVKDVNTAKRPAPAPPPPPQAPTSAARTSSSGSSFSEQAKAPRKAAPVRKKAAKMAPVAVKPPAPAAKPKTAQATARPAIPSPPTGAPISRDRAYLVQLAATRSSEGAREEWKRLRSKHLDLLGRLGLTITKADLGAGKGVFYRLRAGPLADEGSARSLCQILASRQVGCLVIKPMR